MPERKKYKTYSDRRREALQKQRDRWDNGVPDPWTQRKGALPIAVAVIAYAAYAFVARVCVPMIQRRDTARGSRTQGIVLLSFFLWLLCMTLWVR
jgi:palmitoyltransferase